LKKYLKEGRQEFFLSNFLAFINVLCVSYYPYLLSYIVDHFASLNQTTLLFIFSTLILSVVLIVATQYLNKIVKARYQKKICTAIRRDVFESVAHLDYTPFHAQSMETYTSFLINDVERLYALYFENRIYLYNSILMLVAYTVVLAVVSWQMCLAIIGSLMLILFIPQLVGKRFHSLNSAASAGKADYLSRCEEILSAHDLIDGSNRPRLCGLHDKQLEHMQEADFVLEKYRSFVQCFSGSALYFQMIFCFVVGLILSYNGLITVGIFASSLLYVEYVAQYSSNIVDEFLEIRGSKSYREKCSAMLSQPHGEEDADYTPFASLQVNALCYEIGGKALLNHVDYEFTAGKKYLITGANGCGKSTLLKLLAGFLVPTSGQVRINGNPGCRRSDMGYIPQRRYVFAGSLLDNITLFEKDISQDERMRISNICAMLHLTHPLDYVISRNGENLSGGEIAKICLVRELYRGKELLLIDEPMNDIDVHAEADILGFLAKSKKTIIMVAHGLSSDAMFDEVVRVEDGKLFNAKH
jgi:ABC superfamily ATP binding cassette transporter, ATPase and permease protein